MKKSAVNGMAAVESKYHAKELITNHVITIEPYMNCNTVPERTPP
jgi:hypothetical protein